MAVRRSMSGSIGVVVLGLMLALCCATTLVSGKDLTVGDDKGWTFGVAGWENGKVFSAGDVLVFKYDPNMHNVVEVDEAGFNSCTAGAGAKTYTSGNDKITLPGGKTFYICSFPGHCVSGMKIAAATS